MTDRDWLAARFDEQRPQLRRVAYRMLGTLDEADDAVQEAWLRLSRTDTEAIENLGGWLTTVVGRVSLDMLRARRARHETYVGSWLPEPIVTVDDSPNPEEEALVADAVGLALFVVLETLTPPERLAFVLHDMFAVSFEEIAVILDGARLRRDNSRAVPVAAFEVRDRLRTPTCRNNAESWTRSSRRRGRETSRRSSPSSTPRSSSASTPAPTNGEPANRSTAREKSPSSY